MTKQMEEIIKAVWMELRVSLNQLFQEQQSILVIDQWPQNTGLCLLLGGLRMYPPVRRS